MRTDKDLTRLEIDEIYNEAYSGIEKLKDAVRNREWNRARVFVGFVEARIDELDPALDQKEGDSTGNGLCGEGILYNDWMNYANPQDYKLVWHGLRAYFSDARIGHSSGKILLYNNDGGFVAAIYSEDLPDSVEEYMRNMTQEGASGE